MRTGGNQYFHNLPDNLPGTNRGTVWTFAAVEERLVEALSVLWRLPDRESSFLRAGTGATWPKIVRTLDEILDAAPDDGAVRPGAVMRREQADMEEALGWLSYVAEGPSRTIVGLALQQLAAGNSRVAWTRVLDVMIRRGMKAEAGLILTTDSVRMRYGRSLNAICVELNRPKSCI